jgi:AcrR family transcriptional regulator
MKSKENSARLIMDAALAVFADKGLNEVTVRDIARSAGISTAKIYRLFPNKDGLLLAAVVDRLSDMTANLQEHLQGIVGTSNKLIKCIWFILHYYESSPQFASVAFLAIPRWVWHDLMTGTVLQDQASILTEIVEEGQRAGEVRQDVDIRALRALFFGGLERATQLWLGRDMRYALTDTTEELAKLLFNGIRKEPEESPPFNTRFSEQLASLKEELAVLKEEVEALKEAQH